MGCGAFAATKAESPRSKESQQHSTCETLAAETRIIACHEPAVSCPQVEALLEGFGLGCFLQPLLDLGVRSQSDIGELLVSDLEEIGLTRVQVRQLQRAIAPKVQKVDVEAISGADEILLRPPDPPDVQRSCSAALADVDAVKSEARLAVADSHANCRLHRVATVERAPTPTPLGDPSPRASSAQRLWVAGVAIPPSVPASAPVAATQGAAVGGLERKSEKSSLPERKSEKSSLPSGPSVVTAWSETWSDSCVFVQPVGLPTPTTQRSDLEPADPLTATCKSDGEPIGHGLSLSLTATERTERIGSDSSSSASGYTNGVDSERDRSPSPEGLSEELRSGSPDARLAKAMSLEVAEGGVRMPEALQRRLESRGRDLRKQSSCSRKARSDEEGAAAPAQAVQVPRSASTGKAKHRRGRSMDSSKKGGRVEKAGRTRATSMEGRRTSDDDGMRGNRQMFDKNTLRTKHRDVFMSAIQRYRTDVLNVANDIEPLAPDLSSCTLKLSPHAITVYVRKRPLFDKDVQCGDYDAISMKASEQMSTSMVLHNCLFKADLTTPFIQHHLFQFDHVFPEGAQNHDVYRVVASDLVTSARDGGMSTIFMFGQTGSGKTHTMTAIEDAAAAELFQAPGSEPLSFSLVFVELRGHRCFDLLAGRQPPELRLREHADGSYFAEGATEQTPADAAALSAAMRLAHARRATSATDANAVSSRSHAVCIIRAKQSGGELVLVDCAGTERRKDSMYHSKERQLEGAEINASLHALKECIRHLSEKKGVPPHAYRAASLTKLLARAFRSRDSSRLAVLCTASPCALDVEHTLATLRTGVALSGRGGEQEEVEVLDADARAQQKPREVIPKKSSWAGGLRNGDSSAGAAGGPKWSAY